MSWLWSLLALPFIGVLAKIVFDLLTGRRQERVDLRREGSQVVTPIMELSRSLAPIAVAFGSFEENNSFLETVHNDWQTRRKELRTYANHHPNARVRQRSFVLIDSFQRSFSATRYLLIVMHNKVGGTDLKHAHDEATARYADVEAKAEDLMDEIRGGGRLSRLVRRMKRSKPTTSQSG